MSTCGTWISSSRKLRSEKIVDKSKSKLLPYTVTCSLNLCVKNRDSRYGRSQQKPRWDIRIFVMWKMERPIRH